MTIDLPETFRVNMSCRKVLGLIAASMLGAWAALAPSAAQAASCTAKYSPLGGIPNMPPVREQVCTSEADHADLKISFLRLSEAVAGSLARKQPIGELETI